MSSVAFSPDGWLLASGSDDNTVRLWRVEDGALLYTLEGHTESVDSVAFSPDGRLLASADGGVSAAGYDRAVRLWQVKDGALLRMLEGHRRPVISVAFSPDGRLLQRVVVILPQVALLGRKWLERMPYVLPQAFLASISQVLSLLGGTTSSQGAVASGARMPDSRPVEPGYDHRVLAMWLWRVEDGELLHALKGHTDSVNSVAFSPDGRLLASGSDDNTVRLWGIA